MMVRLFSLVALVFVLGCSSGNSDQTAHTPAQDEAQSHEADHPHDDEVYARPSFEGTKVDLSIDDPANKLDERQASTDNPPTSDKTSASTAAKQSAEQRVRESVYQGVTLSQWKQQARDLDTKFRLPAIRAIAVIGQHLADPEIVELLTAAARPESAVDEQIRVEAISGLALMAQRRPNAEIFQTIFRLLRSSNRKTRSLAAAAIAQLDGCWPLPQSLVSVRNSVKSADRLEATVAALVLLSQSPSDAQLALTALTRLYARPESGEDANSKPAVKDEALESLGKGYSVAYLRSIPHVLKVLEKQESDTTVTAMLVLAAALSIEKPSTRHDQHVAQAVKLILPSLKSQQAEVRATAATVLGTIRSTDAQVGRHLFLGMRNDAALAVRHACADALAQLADIHEQVVPSMVDVLRDKTANGRALALSTLGKVLAEEHPATREVMMAVRDSDPAVRSAALLAIEQIGVNENRLVATLQLALQDKNQNVRQQSARILGRLGKKAERAVQSLRVALQQEADRETRQVIASTIHRLAGPWRTNNEQQAGSGRKLR